MARVDLLDILLLGGILYYMVLAPYTKVEESFNIQAIHDMVFLGWDLDKYDHKQFPGSVPRTFIGASFLAGIISLPVQLLPVTMPKMNYQLMARGVLGLVNGLALLYFRRGIERLYGIRRGRAVGRWFVVFTLGQFHVLFYASRTLPNMYAFPLSLVAFTCVMDGEIPYGLELLCLTAAVFRSELVLLAGALSLVVLFAGKLSFWQIVRANLMGGLLGVVMTVSIDSIFWGKFPTFPELQGLFFNIVQGRSVEWGTEPWGNYFLVHLPNLLANPLLLFMGLLGISVTPRRLQLLYLTALIYVTIYSFQPHKELRFIIYTAPIFTATAARGVDYLYYRQWRKSFVIKVLITVTAVTALLSIGMSVVKAQTSADNYPGGAALQAFHSLPHAHGHKTVHMDVATCMTGASRFGQELPGFVYDKTEDAKELQEALPFFDFYIGTQTNPASIAVAPGYTWQPRVSVPAFAGVDVAFAKGLINAAFKDPKAARQGIQDFLLPIAGLSRRVRDLWYRLIVLEDTIFVYERVPIA